MKRSVRIISVLLAMLMALSTMILGVSAEYADYTNPAGYNSLQHPYISAEQCGSYILDKIDALLYEQDIEGNFDYLVGSLDYDFTSVDKALNTLEDIVNSGLYSFGTGLLNLGDLEDININAIRRSNGCPRRTTPGRTDLELFYAITQFLYDNKNLLGRVVDSCWDNGGIVKRFFNVNEKVGDVQGKIREILFDALYGDGKFETKVTKDSNLDVMIDQFLYHLIVGGKDKKSDGTYEWVDGFLPGLEQELIKNGAMKAAGAANFHLKDITVYTLFKCAIDAALVKYVQPLLMDVFSDMDETVLSAIYGFLELPETTTPEEFVTSLLDLKNGVLSRYLRIDDTGVYLQDDFFTLFSSLISFAKGLINSLSLYPNIDKVPDEDLSDPDKYPDSRVVAYLVRTILEGYPGLMDSVQIPANVESLREVATYLLINFMSDKMPEIDYQAMIRNGTINPKTDGFLEVLADLAYYYLNATTDMDIPANISFDATVKKIYQWVVDKVGGVLRTNNLTSSDPWVNIDILLWQNVLNINWLGDDFQNLTVGNQTKTLLFNKIIDSVLDWDFHSLTSIFRKNTSGNGELDLSVTDFLITFVKRILSGVFEGNTIIPNEVKCFEDIVADFSNCSDSNKTNLRKILENVISNIVIYDEPILQTVLPLYARTISKLDSTNYEMHAGEGMFFDDEYLELRLKEQNPSENGELQDVSYDDPAYVFFGSEDFSPLYKYYNYKKVRKRAQTLLEKYQDDLAEVTPEDITDISYRLDLYYSRLTKRIANVSKLRNALDEAQLKYGHGEYGTASGTAGNSSQYTLSTWRVYNEAYNWANSVYEAWSRDSTSVSQSKVTFARQLIIVAFKSLKIKGDDADYSTLDKYIALAQAAFDAYYDGLYVQDTYEALQAAFLQAMAVDRGYDIDDQETIDAVVEILMQAYKDIKYNPQLAKVSGASTVLDKVNKYVWGIKEGTSNFISYLQVLGAGIMTTVDTSNGKGTGTVVMLKNGDDIIDQYTVIIFGDLDGNSQANGGDAVEVYAYYNEFLESSDFTVPQLKAADADGDGDVDMADYNKLVQSGLLKYKIEQSRTSL
ncbi:MAG: hypothetical protein K6F09_02640 [Clostridiales bacterium]|nr:hypothetical protein [Clostridiales bacterium]